MNLKHLVRDIGFFGIGAAAILVEAGSKAAQTLVRKGAQTLQDNQGTMDDLKRRARDFYDRTKERFSDAPDNRPMVDLHQLTPEQRAELRRQLDEADQTDAPAEPTADDAAREDELPDDTDGQDESPLED